MTLSLVRESRPVNTHRAQHRASTLAGRFEPAANALWSLRLLLAGTVAVAHAIANGYGWQPMLRETRLGDLAVAGFFVLSGFLVTRSYLRLGAFWRYTWHRFLRLMPGFWVCLLVTALVLAPVLAVAEGRPVTSVFSGDSSALHYLARNCLLLMQQYDINGLPDTQFSPGVLDGSLWTLFYEALCYAALAVLGALGVLRNHRWLVLAAAIGLTGLHVAAAVTGAAWPGTPYLIPLACAFFLGAAAHLFGEHIPITRTAAVAALAVLLVTTLAVPVLSSLSTVAVAYLCLWATVRLPWRSMPSWDLSYGLYIYHWPIQQALIVAGAAALGLPVLVVLSIALALAAAAASWLLVEAPALRFKDAGLRRTVPRRR